MQIKSDLIIICLALLFFAVTAATGYSSHRLDFVSESYGGAKKKNKVTDNKSPQSLSRNASLWDAVRQENIQIVHTERRTSVFEVEDGADADGNGELMKMKEYNSSETEEWSSPPF